MFIRITQNCCDVRENVAKYTALLSQNDVTQNFLYIELGGLWKQCWVNTLSYQAKTM